MVIIKFAPEQDLAASTIFVSHQSAVKQENEVLSVLCKEQDNGAAVLWKGSKKKTLGEKTNPAAKARTFGVQLLFNKIRKEDAGVYTCETKNGEESADFTLFVEGPLMFVDTPLEQQGEEGTDIIIKCDVKGGHIDWLIDAQTPQEPKYRMIADGLVVVNATKEDAKNYTCKGVSEATGEMEDRTIFLTITHPPRLPSNTTEKHYMRQQYVFGYIGGTVNLSCEVEAEPPPKFTWFEKSNRKKIGEVITSDNPYQSVLMLMMTWKNMGDYKCRAENEFGRLDVIFILLNGSQPSPPSYLKFLESTSDTLTLEIDGPEPTEEEIRSNMVPMGYRVEYRENVGNESSDWMAQTFPLSEAKTYSLTQLAPTTQYEVRAATENPAGLSDFTNTSLLTTKPNAANTFNNSQTTFVASFAFSILVIFLHGLLDSPI